MPLIQTPGKKHASLEGASIWETDASVSLRRESPAIITHGLFLVVLIVTRQADWAALLSSSICPDVMGLSSSVRRAVNRFRKGTSGFEGSVFLLLVLVGPWPVGEFFAV